MYYKIFRGTVPSSPFCKEAGSKFVWRLSRTETVELKRAGNLEILKLPRKPYRKRKVINQKMLALGIWVIIHHPAGATSSGNQQGQPEGATTPVSITHSARLFQLFFFIHTLQYFRKSF